MYDIVFYYIQGHSHNEILEAKQKYPTAKFLALDKNNYVSTAQIAISLVKTSKFWLIPVGIGISKPTLPYTIPSWDERYIHYQKLGNLEIFLISKKHIFTDDQIEKNFFNDTKFVDFNIFYRDLTHTYDVFFISYNEPTAEKNYEILKKKVPTVKRIHGIKGIYQAHVEAAKNSSTSFFWVVDADAEILEDFDFNFEVPLWDFDVTHIWKSKNTVNGLEYGNGGVKLIPRHLILDANSEIVDVTTSLGNIKIIDKISNFNNFATDEFSAWRSAFRECVKLSSKVIYGQIDETTENCLAIWCTHATGPYREQTLSGAMLGYIYGKNNAGNIDALLKINDFDWLHSYFVTNSTAIGNI